MEKEISETVVDMKKQEQKIRIAKKLLKAGVDPATVDIEAEIDSSLSYKENLDAIKAKFIISVEPSSAYYARKEAEQNSALAGQEQMLMLRENQHALQTELEASIQQPMPVIDEMFSDARQLVRSLVASDKVHGMVFVGPPGLGKTTTVEQELVRLGKKRGDDYWVVTGYITPLALFNTLYKHNGKILVFDDIMKLLDNEINRGILQAALWNPTGIRMVDYGSTSPKLEAPQSFRYNGKVIWCVNHFPKDFDAMKSRVFYHELDFSYEEKIKLMFEVAKLNNISPEIPEFVYNETKEAGAAFNIDFRLLFKLQALKNVNPDWKGLAKRLLAADPDMIALIRCLQMSPSIKDACHLWTEQTGKSRPTFFRLKKSLKVSET